MHAQARLGSLTFHNGAHLVYARFKFICTARAGDFFIILGKASFLLHKFIESLTAQVKGAASKEGSRACDSVEDTAVPARI